MCRLIYSYESCIQMNFISNTLQTPVRVQDFVIFIDFECILSFVEQY